MPAATDDVINTEEVCGYLNVRYKAGKKFRWKKKYAVLKQDSIQLSDEKESIPDDTAELRLAEVFNTCGAYSDKKAKKKHGFVLEPIDWENHDQWYFTCEDDDQQQRWMNAINDVISGKKVQKAVSCPEFDEIIVQTTTLQHLAKDRPRFHGRRLPAKRPRSDNALNGIPEDSKSETPDSSQPTSPAKDLASNGASTSAPASPAIKITKETSPAVKRRQKRSTFLKGIGARVSRIFGTQQQTPRSPTSPARLDVEAASPQVPVAATTSLEQKITKVDEVEDEEVPDDVSKDDIIKMLDFVSETTEQIVYKTVGIRGTISSVDDDKARSEMQRSWKSMRKVVNALKTTMDNLSVVEEELKTAPEMKPDRGTSSAITPRASAPIAVDEDDDDAIGESNDQPDSSGDVADRKSGDLPEASTDKPLVGLNDSLDNVEDFEERKPSVSLMEAIEKTFNGHKSLMHKDSVSTNASGIIEEKDETLRKDSVETKQDVVGAKQDAIETNEDVSENKKKDGPIVAPDGDKQNELDANDEKTQGNIPTYKNQEKEEEMDKNQEKEDKKGDEKEDQFPTENQDKEKIEEESNEMNKSEEHVVESKEAEKEEVEKET